MIFFSVVICTYNREDLLRRVLASFIQQSLSFDEFEILVIDNNSTDNTSYVVSQYKSSLNNLKYFSENKIGLSHARNRGIGESNGKYVVYTDDDCEIPVDWLLNAKKIIELNDFPIIGGPVLAFYMTEKGKWYKDEYALLGHGDTAKVLEVNEYLFGGNLFVRYDMFKKYGDFKPELGMNGTTIGYSEETELQIRIRKVDKTLEIYYDPALYVYHLVRPEKLKISWWISSFLSKGRANYIVQNNSGILKKAYFIPSLFRIVRVSLKIFVCYLRAFTFRDKAKYPAPQNFIYECMHAHFKELGYLLAMAKHTKLF